MSLIRQEKPIWKYMDRALTIVGVTSIVGAFLLFVANSFLRFPLEIMFAFDGVLGGYGGGLLTDEYRSAVERRKSELELEILRGSSMIPVVQRQCHAWLLGYYFSLIFMLNVRESKEHHNQVVHEWVKQYLRSLGMWDEKFGKQIDRLYSSSASKRAEIAEELKSRMSTEDLLPFFHLPFLIAGGIKTVEQPEVQARLVELLDTVKEAGNPVINDSYLKEIEEYIDNTKAIDLYDIRKYIDSVNDALPRWISGLSKSPYSALN